MERQSLERFIETLQGSARVPVCGLVSGISASPQIDAVFGICFRGEAALCGVKRWQQGEIQHPPPQSQDKQGHDKPSGNQQRR